LVQSLQGGIATVGQLQLLQPIFGLMIAAVFSRASKCCDVCRYAVIACVCMRQKICIIYSSYKQLAGLGTPAKRLR
jgi:hypothetical protein